MDGCACVCGVEIPMVLVYIGRRSHADLDGPSSPMEGYGIMDQLNSSSTVDCKLAN
jgi:hypothetical protein